MLSSFLLPCWENPSISLIHLKPSSPWLPDEYLDPALPWIKIPCDLSLPIRQEKVNCLAFLSKHKQFNYDQSYLPVHTSKYLFFFSPVWFPHRYLSTSCLFELTVQTVSLNSQFSNLSHQVLIHLSKGKFISTGMSPISQELRWILSRDKKKLAWWNALHLILYLQFLTN